MQTSVLAHKELSKPRLISRARTLTIALAITPVFLVQSYAQETLQAADIIEAIKHFHPKLHEVAAKRKQANLEEIRLAAAFDPVVSQSTILRPSGYYDGQYIDQKVTQRIAGTSAKVFGGYRISEGNFPEYEGELRTLSAGEANIGIGFSLLQNRETDKDRTALKNALLAQENWRAREQAVLNTTIYKGLSTYLNWYQASLQLLVVSELVEATEARLAGIETRVANGDLAKINLTEFNATLLSRQLSEQRAKRALALAKQELVFYWRDQHGNMRDVEDIPALSASDIHWPFSLQSHNAEDLTQKVYQHPNVKVLKAEIDRARNNERLSAEGLKPKLDLALKLARDVGSGSDTLTGTEGKIELAFSMPLGVRAAKAKRSQAREKINELNFALVNLVSELERDVLTALTSYNYGKTVLKLNQQQAEVANELLKQELTRFRVGDSDLFVLNSREASAIQAKLSAIAASVDLLKSEIHVLLITGTLIEV